MRNFRIGIDIDEVVAEFMQKYLPFFNEKFAREVSFDGMNSYNVWDVSGVSREESLLLSQELFDNGSFDDFELVEGAGDSVKALGKHNKIYFITSRPESWKKKTFSFLKTHFGEISFKIIFSGGVWGAGKSKGELCNLLGINFFIEDNYDCALSAAQAGVKTFFLEKPWNVNSPDHDNLIKAKTWRDVEIKIISDMQ